MSCECQVANRDPAKPCPSCGEVPAKEIDPALRRANEKDRIKGLLKMAGEKR